MTAFVPELAASLLGSLVGVGGALWIDRRAKARRRATEREENLRLRQEEEATQLRLVDWLVEENVELARQVLEGVAERAVFFFRMNTHLLDSAVREIAIRTDDLTLLWRAEHFRYQLHHLNDKLKAYSDDATYQGQGLSSARRFLDAKLGPSLRAQLETQVLPAAAELRPLLATRIQRLSRAQVPPIRPPLSLRPGSSTELGSYGERI